MINIVTLINVVPETFISGNNAGAGLQLLGDCGHSVVRDGVSVPQVEDDGPAPLLGRQDVRPGGTQIKNKQIRSFLGY